MREILSLLCLAFLVLSFKAAFDSIKKPDDPLIAFYLLGVALVLSVATLAWGQK